MLALYTYTTFDRIFTSKHVVKQCRNIFINGVSKYKNAFVKTCNFLGYH